MDPHIDIILKEEQDRDMFGFSVSNEGDVNNDGYDDVIVGAQGYYSGGYDAGRVYVYYGGAGMDTIADLVMTGEHAGDYFGSTVSDAGDLNNDGFADLLVSAYHYENIDKEPGRVYIYYGGSTKDTIADLVFYGSTGQSAGDINQDGFGDLLVNGSVFFGGSAMDTIADMTLTGSRIAGDGDYNNDGYDDVITGNPYDSENGDHSGSVSIFYGGSQLHSDPDVVFSGASGNDYYGSCVSYAGDLNGDGYNDIIIGSPGCDQAAKDAGCAYVYFGSGNISNEPDLTFTGQKASGHFGESVSSAGDVNGDGFSDIIVGGLATEQASLYLGNKAMDNMADLIFKWENSSNHFGNSVSCAGDFNNDGFDDIIIGDFCNHVKGTNTGRAYLYFGGLSLDSIPDLIFDGEASLNNFGQAVACAGDVNKDGYSDIMIGAPGYENDNEDRIGRIYIYFGNSMPDANPDVIITGTELQRSGSYMAAAGDVNNDGYDDIIAAAPFFGNSPYGISYVNVYYGGADMDNIADLIIEKMQFGFGSGVSGAGDLNNDGFDDIMIGGHGNVNIYYGGIDMDTVADLIINNIGNSWDEFGRGLSIAGDINNDGCPDLLIGEPYSNASGNNMGRVYIYSKKTGSNTTEVAETLSLHQNFPNPFNTETSIIYSLQKPGQVVIKIFNSSGQELETLVTGYHGAGEHTITWRPKNLPCGLYFYKVYSSEFSETKKMLLLK